MSEQVVCAARPEVAHIVPCAVNIGHVRTIPRQKVAVLVGRVANFCAHELLVRAHIIKPHTNGHTLAVEGSANAARLVVSFNAHSLEFKIFS